METLTNGEAAPTLFSTVSGLERPKKLCVASICRTRISTNWAVGKEFVHSDVRDLTGLPASSTKAISAFLSEQVLKRGEKYIKRVHSGAGGASGLYKIVLLPIPDEARAAPVALAPRKRNPAKGPVSASGLAGELLAFAVRLEQAAANLNDPHRYAKMSIDELFAERKAIDAVIERRARRAAK